MDSGFNFIFPQEVGKLKGYRKGAKVFHSDRDYSSDLQNSDVQWYNFEQNVPLM